MMDLGVGWFGLFPHVMRRPVDSRLRGNDGRANTPLDCGSSPQ